MLLVFSQISVFVAYVMFHEANTSLHSVFVYSKSLNSD